MTRRGPDARSLANLYAPAGSLPFNARDYGAVGDGVTDDTGAIASALSDACVSGGRVILPDSPCLISQPLIITSDNVEVIGHGWASQLIAAPGFPAGPMIQVQAPGGGVFRYGIRMADFFLNGNNVAGVGGLDLQTTYHGRIEHVRIRYCKGIGIHLNGSSGNTGAYNLIDNCTITDGGAGTAIQTDFNEWNTFAGGTISFYNGAGGIGIKCQNLNCRFLGVGFDNNDTALQLEFAGRATVIGCQFDRGQTRFIYMHGTQYALIAGNSFNTYNGAAGVGCIDVTDANNAGNVITGNAVRGASGWTNFINEHGTVGTPANTYTGNDTGGSAIVLVNGVARGNRGYNPKGNIAAPAVPATTVAYTNAFGVDCTVHVTGGTVTAIAIGGVATGLTSGSFRVPAGQTITLTYSVAPTWTWFGD